MKISQRLIFTVVFGALVGGCATARHSGYASDLAQARMRLERAYDAGRLQELVNSYYAPDATLIVGSAATPLIGRAAIASFWEPILGATQLRVDPTGVERDCDLIVERGAYIITIGRLEAPSSVERSEYLAVWKKGDEGWRVVMQSVKAVGR